jgi:hypothetical protein
MERVLFSAPTMNGPYTCECVKKPWMKENALHAVAPL